MKQFPDNPASRVCLRPLRPENARNFALLLGGVSRSVSVMARIPHPCTRTAAQAWIDEHSEPGSCAFAIIRKRDRNFLGAIALNTDKIVPELGYWVGRPYWSCGYATEAVLALESLALRRGINRLAAETFPQNQASQKVLLKSGFRQEGDFVGGFTSKRDDNHVFRYEKELCAS